MDFNTIQGNTNWGKASGDVNANFQKAGVELDKVKSTIDTMQDKVSQIEEDVAGGRSPNRGLHPNIISFNNDVSSGKTYPPRSGDFIYLLDSNTKWNYVDNVWVNTGKPIPEDVLELEDYAKNGGSDKTMQQVDDEKADKVSVISKNEFKEKDEVAQSDSILLKMELDNKAQSLNYDKESFSNGVVSVKPSAGYTALKTENPVSFIGSKYMFIGTRDASITIYPLEIVIDAYSRTFNIACWLNKTQYPNGIMSHCAVIIDGNLTGIGLHIPLIDIKEGFSGISSGSGVVVTSKILKIEGNYFYLQMQVNSTISDVSKCSFIPYAAPSSSGAVVGVNYEFIGIYADTSVTEIGNPLEMSNYATIPFNKFMESFVSYDLPSLFKVNRIYTLVGRTYVLHKDNLLSMFNSSGYFIDIDTSDESGRDYNDCWEYTPTTAKTITLTARLYSDTRELLDTHSFPVISVSAAAWSTARKLMLIGNSFTWSNIIPDELHRVLTSSDAEYTTELMVFPSGLNLGNLTMIGSQIRNDEGYTGQQYHEGYSGWELKDFLSSGVGTTPNPFWHNGKLDFKAYFSNTGYDVPDTIAIGIAWNDVAKNEYDFKNPSIIVSRAETLLDAIFRDYPNMKVIWWCESFPGRRGQGRFGWGSSSRIDVQLWKLKQKYLYEAYINLEQKYPNLTVAVDTVLRTDCYYNFQLEEVRVNPRNTKTHFRGTDPVHPNSIGYGDHVDGLAPYIAVPLIR